MGLHDVALLTQEDVGSLESARNLSLIVVKFLGSLGGLGAKEEVGSLESARNLCHQNGLLSSLCNF